LRNQNAAVGIHGGRKNTARCKRDHYAWEQRKLGDVVDILTGYPFQSQHFSSHGTMLIRGTNVKRGYLDSSHSNTVYWETKQGLERYLLAENDIVIQMDGALIGKSYALVLKGDLPSMLVQRVARLRCDKADPTFIYQSIQRGFLKYIRMNKTETAVPHLSSSNIQNYIIAVPTIQEQHQLGAFFASLDDLIALHQRKPLW
jgi:restriction endonuclease S subunit